MRAAKARAAERGESLKSLFERAVLAELGRGNRRAGAHSSGFPVIRSKRAGVEFSNEDLDDILTADDIHGLRP